METTPTLKKAAETLVREIEQEVARKKAEVALLENRLEQTATLCNSVPQGDSVTTQESPRVAVNFEEKKPQQILRSHHAVTSGKTAERIDWPGVIQNLPDTLTIKDVMRHTGVTKGYATSRVHAMKKQQYLRSVEGQRGLYEKTPKAQRHGRN